MASLLKQTCLIAFSESPTHLLNISGPYEKTTVIIINVNQKLTLIDIKLKQVSVAKALTIIVLLQPGGPYNSIPLTGLNPILSSAYKNTLKHVNNDIIF